MDFNSLKQEHPEIKDRLSKIELSYKKSELLLEFADHAGVKLILDALSALNEDINNRLIHNRNLTLQERETLFVKRECFEWLGDQFSTAKDYLVGANNLITKL